MNASLPSFFFPQATIPPVTRPPATKPDVARRRRPPITGACRWLWCFLLGLLVTELRGELALSSFFASNMVLQRDRQIAIWGTGTSGVEVTAELGGNAGAGTVDDSGYWRIALGPLPAGGPYELSINATGQASIVRTNVMLGDVWLASGQSNMEWTVANSGNAAVEIRQAEYPDIRLFAVPKVRASRPQETALGSWQAVDPTSVRNFSAVAYYFGRYLHTELGVPIGLMDSTWGGTPVEDWTPREVVEAKLGSWRTPGNSGVLYNAMIHPFTKLPIRGVIWYQGESNVPQAEAYRTLFPAMMQSWREAWNNQDLPFGFVQIAPYMYAEPPEEAAELRQAQFFAAETVPNTGMVVTMDIGNPVDIHPRNKQEVGRRLGLWALSQVYGQNMIYSGPLFEGETVSGGSILCHFRHADGGLATLDGNPPSHLEIAGADRVYHPATGSIDGSTLIVSSPNVPEPMAVRYAWSDDVEPNLMNTQGLPASPFQTMDWHDTDGDGFEDRGEFAAGTDFQDPTSLFQIQSWSRSSRAGRVLMTVEAFPGAVFEVHLRDQLDKSPYVPSFTYRYEGSEPGPFEIEAATYPRNGPYQYFMMSVH